MTSPVVDEEDIAYIVASWTGVPVNKLTESESEKLLQMEDILHQRLIGQEQAVKAISVQFVAPELASVTPIAQSPVYIPHWGG